MRVYTVTRFGSRKGQRAQVQATVRYAAGAYPLHHHVKHSPTGFEFGYGGSAPSELARCLLWDHLDEEPSPACYQDFKWAFVAPAPPQGFTLTTADIDRWLVTWRLVNAERHGGAATITELEAWLMADSPG